MQDWLCTLLQQRLRNIREIFVAIDKVSKETSTQTGASANLGVWIAILIILS